MFRKMNKLIIAALMLAASTPALATGSQYWGWSWYGYGIKHKHKHIVSPIPEPSTYAMLLVGLGLVAWKVKWKKDDDE